MHCFVIATISSLSFNSDTAPANVPSTPKSAVRRQSLATTALMNSARKAIESAKKASAARSRLASAPQKADRNGEGTPRKRPESAADGTLRDQENVGLASQTSGKV